VFRTIKKMLYCLPYKERERHAYIEGRKIPYSKMPDIIPEAEYHYGGKASSSGCALMVGDWGCKLLVLCLIAFGR
jgi:hypothetical protein